MNDLKQATLTVTPAQFSAILAGLDKLPGEVSRVLYGELCKQVEAQLEAHKKAPVLEAVS